MSSAPGRAGTADAPNPRDKRRATVLTVSDSDDEWAEHTPAVRTRAARATRLRMSDDDDGDDAAAADATAAARGMSHDELVANYAKLMATVQRLEREKSVMQSPAPAPRFHLPLARTSRTPPPEFDMETAFKAIIDDIEGKTGFTDLTPNLTFNHRDYVRRVLVKLSKGDKSALVCGGSTQSQKTGFKVVMYIIAHYLKIGTIVVTKNVFESKDLADKIKSLLGKRPAAALVFSQTGIGRGTKGVDMCVHPCLQQRRGVENIAFAALTFSLVQTS
jgi:hypothetical protein